MAQYDLNLRDYWRTVRKRKFIVLFTAASMGFFSLVWALVGQPPPIYKTSVSIKIEKTGSLTGLYSQTFPWSSTNYLETQASVIKSYIILESVAKKLNLIPANLTSEQIRTNGDYLKVILDLKANVTTEQEGNTDIITIYVTSEDPRFAQLFANTIAQAYKEEHLVDINKRTFDAKTFIENQLNIVRDKVTKSEEAVRDYRETSKIISIDAQSASSLAQSSKLQAQYDLDTATLQKVNTVLQALATAEDRSLTSKSSFYFEEATPIYKNLNDKLVQLMLERDTLLITYTEAFPQIHEIKNQAHEIITSMRSQLSSQKKNLESNVTNLKQQIGAADEQLRLLPEKGLELVRFEREAAVNREVYSLLQKKYQEALIQDAEKIEEVKVVRPALEPTTPVNPPKVVSHTTIGLIIGLIMGIVFAFIMETFDTSFEAIEEVEEFLGVRVLGIIPQVNHDELKAILQDKYSRTADEDTIKKTNRLISHFLPSSTSAENYRALRTNLNFLNLDKSIKSIVFTSSSPEEGKTTVAVNLAITMAQGGSKVLLIEGDLRRAVIAKLFGIEPVPGLADVILGNYEWRTVVRTITDFITGKMTMDEIMLTPGMDNLHIITGGSHSPNPAELVSSKLVPEIIKQASSEYDIILIDAPPVLAATEASIWSSVADGAIIVYQVGKIARGALKRAKAQLDHVGARIFGVVLNGLKADISPDFAYRDKKYYYYYGDQTLRKSSLAEMIVALPQTVTDYLKSIVSKASVKWQARPPDAADSPAPPPAAAPAPVAAPAPAVEAETELVHHEEAQKATEEKPQGKISRLKIVILLFALLFLVVGIMFQTGVIQYDVKNILPRGEPQRPTGVEKTTSQENAQLPASAVQPAPQPQSISIEEKKPVPESIQPPAAPAQTAPPKESMTPQAVLPKAADDKDWGVILYVKDKTNIRADRSIESRIRGQLEPGQKIKADFLEDDWYAVFKVKETKHDAKRALGYVYAPRLLPPEAIQAQATVPQTAEDWGVILYVKDKTNIRAGRSIESRIRGQLEPGQKIKADFLEDDWYAVFKVKETKRDIKRALGYVHSPRLFPVDAAKKD
jgi:capsular exopolysaccharide synthesis family protein